MKKNNVWAWQVFSAVLVIGWIIGGTWAMRYRFDKLNDMFDRDRKIEEAQLIMLNSLHRTVDDDHVVILSLQNRVNELNNAFIEDGIKTDRRLHMVEQTSKSPAHDRLKKKRK